MNNLFCKFKQILSNKKTIVFLPLFFALLGITPPYNQYALADGIVPKDCNAIYTATEMCTSPSYSVLCRDRCNQGNSLCQSRGLPTQDKFDTCWNGFMGVVTLAKPVDCSVVPIVGTGLYGDPYPGWQDACRACNAECADWIDGITSLAKYRDGCFNPCMTRARDAAMSSSESVKRALGVAPGSIDDKVISGTSTAISAVGSAISSAMTVGAAVQWLLVYTLILPGKLLGWIGWVIAYAAQALLKFILNFILSIKITNCVGAGNATVQATCQTLQVSWAVIRDWADMLIVLGIIMVAMATIINFEKYKAQHWLPKLLLVAVLVNFSSVFVGFMVDASNVPTRQFLSGSNDGGEGTIIDALNTNFTSADNKVQAVAQDPKLGWGDVVGKALLLGGIYSSLGFLYICTGIAYLYAAGLLFARYAILSFLYILSPLAFVFFVFPIEKAKGLWSEWWSHFIKWCFVGVGSGFAIYLAGTVLKVPGLINAADINFDKELQDNLKTIFIGYTPIFIALMFLYVGNRTAIKTATKVAGAIIGVATTAGVAIASGGTSLLGSGLGAVATSSETGLLSKIPYLRKAIGKPAGWGNKAVVGSKGLAQRTMSGFQYTMDRAKETIYPELAGTAMANWRKRQMKRLEPMKEGYADIALTDEGRKRLAVIQKTGTRDQRVAATMALNDVKGGLEYLGNKGAQETAIRETLNYGVRGKDIVKNPDNAHLDEEAIQNMTAKRVAEKEKTLGRKLTAAEITTERSEAVNDHRKKLYASFRVEGIEDKSNSEVIDKAKEATAEGTRYLEEAVKRGIIKSVTAYPARLRNARDQFGSNAIDRAPSADYRLAPENARRVAELTGIVSKQKPTWTPIAVRAEAERRATQEQLATNLPKMSRHEISQIDTAHIDINMIKQMTPNQISAFQNSDPVTVAHVKSFVASLQGEESAEVTKGITTGNPNNAKINKLRDIIEAIQKLP